MEVKIDRDTVNKDINKAKINGYFSMLSDFYKRVPKTTCNECGKCCYASPEISYSEFLYIYDYMKQNFDKALNTKIISKAIKTHMYELVKPGHECCFLDDNNKCLIYQRAPLSCKFWGLYSIEEYNKNIEYDKSFNDKFREYYKQQGVHISDEVMNFKIEYCNNVSICEKDKKIFDFDKIEKYGMKKIYITNKVFASKQLNGCAIMNYLAHVMLGKRAVDDRILLSKAYLDDNYNAIDDYVSQLSEKDLFL